MNEERCDRCNVRCPSDYMEECLLCPAGICPVCEEDAGLCRTCEQTDRIPLAA